MTKVLISGASGFIGQALTSEFRKLGWGFQAMDRQQGDVAHIETWTEVGEDDFDFVFHIAGRIFIPESWKHPLDYYQTNMMGTATALEFCRHRKIPIIYISSYLYGIPEVLPIAEDALLKPNNPYAHSKYLAEEVCRFYASVYGVDVTIIRPFNVYGEGQPKSLLIPSIISQVMHADKIQVMDLTPRRDYVHIDDLVDALVRSTTGTGGVRIYNIGSGCSYSVSEVIELAQSCAGTDKPVISKQVERMNEIPDVVADCTNVQRELGWKCRVSFEQGIRRLIEKAI